MFRTIIKTVEVRRRHEVVDRSPDYTPLWIVVTLAHGYNFENWLDWPQCEDNWPSVFDKVTIDKDRIIHFQNLFVLLLIEPLYEAALSSLIDMMYLLFRDYSKRILNGFKTDKVLETVIKLVNLGDYSHKSFR